MLAFRALFYKQSPYLTIMLARVHDSTFAAKDSEKLPVNYHLEKSMFERERKAFLAASANKMLPAILFIVALLCGGVGAALGMSFIWSAYAGLMLQIAALWASARQARIRHECAATGGAR